MMKLIQDQGWPNYQHDRVLELLCDHLETRTHETQHLACCHVWHLTQH